MKLVNEYLIIAPDGRRAVACLPVDAGRADAARAPSWLVKQFGLRLEADEWFLHPLQSTPHNPEQGVDAEDESRLRPSLCLARTAIAAANKTPVDPRQTRLRKEKMRLRQLTQESDYVKVEEINVPYGGEPENYRVTFLCRGIIGIDSAQRPIFGEKHQVEILCDDDFPSDVPRLRWLTPIWHPNIQHQEPKGVCVNKPEWLGGMGLDDLCRLMFEMVQYKNYHAEYTQPYPLDQEVARWVLEYAEPRNIVNKKRGISIDNKPFIRPTETRYISMLPSKPAPATAQRIKLIESAPASNTISRIKIVDAPASVETTETSTAQTNRIKIVNKNE